MKIKAKFTVKSNKLLSADGVTEIPISCPVRTEAADVYKGTFEIDILKKAEGEPAAAKNKFLFIDLPQSFMEISSGAYNETALASLRDFLKAIEKSEINVVIAPRLENDSDIRSLQAGSSDSQGSFIAAVSHAARRIKDCESVIGFAIPEKLLAGGLLGEKSLAAEYISELKKKHEHYIFFAEQSEIEKAHCMSGIANTDIVMY
ncbi:hypothetical protein HRI96_11385 [Treponema parvum]|uniref:Macro domain-containing protein n=1 Tax=Treponema parvum TaxID=138851 RepID=A0A975F1V2_9SPIR|nr:hypothetical protein [Treponema parvum]QTQ12745.1 hypothetical protein HRI96_11385 [Treponema parvum]